MGTAAMAIAFTMKKTLVGITCAGHDDNGHANVMSQHGYGADDSVEDDVNHGDDDVVSLLDTSER